VALPGGDARGGRPGEPGRGVDPPPAGPPAGGRPGARPALREGRGFESHRIVQGPGALGGGHHGPGAGCHPAGDPDGGQRRSGAGGLWGRRGTAGGRLLSRRHARRVPAQHEAAGGPGSPGGRSHRCLRGPGPRGGRDGGLVRSLHAEGALSPGGEEDHGIRAGGAARRRPPRRDHLSHRRRHGRSARWRRWDGSVGRGLGW